MKEDGNISLHNDDEYDFIIVGSGSGSILAALKVQEAGLRPLIIEKTDLFGGSSAMSGGGVWLPNNAVMKREDRLRDNAEKARTYMNLVIGEETRGSSKNRRDKFIELSPKVVDFLETKGMKFDTAGQYCDYYDELPGGIGEYSRSLQAQLFNINKLG